MKFFTQADTTPELVWEVLVDVISYELGLARECIHPDLNFVKDLNLG